MKIKPKFNIADVAFIVVDNIVKKVTIIDRTITVYTNKQETEHEISYHYHYENNKNITKGFIWETNAFKNPLSAAQTIMDQALSEIDKI